MKLEDAIRAVSAGLVVAATAAAVSAQEARYLVPPAEVARAIDGSVLPTPVVSPAGDVIALVTQNSMPSISELAEPMLRLAGMRINPDSNSSHFSYRSPTITALAFKRIEDGHDTAVALPRDGRFGNPEFSPDGSRFVLTQSTPKGLALWMISVADGKARALTGPVLNGTWGKPCEWLQNGRELLCKLVAAKRGPVPPRPAVPAGPTVQEHTGKAAPVRTNQDLLTGAYDDTLFEYYFTSQLALVNASTGQLAPVGQPDVFEQASPSLNGDYIVVSRVKRPFSRLVPAGEFAKDVEVVDRHGVRRYQVGSLPLAETVPINGVRTGARWVRWHPTEPATVVWVEALDGGDPAAKVLHRDRVLTHIAPFAGQPRELARTEYRFQSLTFTERGIGLLNELDRPQRKLRTWMLVEKGAPRMIFERMSEDRYADPGAFVAKPAGAPVPEFGAPADTPILQFGSSVYLAGEGASPEGDRPFLDRIDLNTLKTERLFRSEGAVYENVLAVITPDATRFLTRRESPTSPPNVVLRESAGKRSRALTTIEDPAPDVSRAEKQLLTYKRKDGVSLSATLYVPRDRPTGERLPMIIWAYPREFADARVASQVVGSPYRYVPVGFANLHMSVLLRGYALMVPTMPIVGTGETANDTYVEQLVASAEAAIDKAVEIGIADRDRVGVAGHSYGAFMTANLLAHSDIFRAGIALSGAYNRSLTPFGFQSERRTFWEAPQLYSRMSPFWHADKVNEPILLLHGEVDNNQGTFPIQSERFYMALKGHGATVRYIVLPHESHRYAARETLLHVTAEYLNWFDRYVKTPPSKVTSGLY